VGAGVEEGRRGAGREEAIVGRSWAAALRGFRLAETRLPRVTRMTRIGERERERERGGGGEQRHSRGTRVHACTRERADKRG